MTPEQREKLPRYAQEEIKNLEIRVHNLEEALEQYQMRTPSKVTWGWDFKDQAWGYLKDRETITFVMTEKPNRELRVRLKEDNCLDINCDGSLVIKPGASNSATVHTE